jgi:hypothetical protein
MASAPPRGAERALAAEIAARMTPRKTPRPNGAAVPFLPGHSVSNPMQVHHPLSQTLQYKLDSAADNLPHSKFCNVPPVNHKHVTAEALQIHMTDPAFRLDCTGSVTTHAEREDAKASARKKVEVNDPPAWLKHDRQVLRFFAYFQEPVHENPNENYRMRHCTIYFYLEDGTMQINEPKIENSGVPQGAFVKRHRIPKPKEAGGGFYTPSDLKCGINLTMYARTFRIISCDSFTKWFYDNALLDIGELEEPPVDGFQELEMRKKMDVSQMGGATRDVIEGKEYTELSLGGARKNAKIQQFLANDRKVLRFKVFWDDPTRYGSRQYFVLHYFLSDDTVEILGEYARNCGRDPYPAFYKRSPLRKNPIISPTPAMLEPEPVLYKPEDFVVGQTIDVLGRSITLYDCDDFTRDFYMGYCGFQQSSIPIEEPAPSHSQLCHPPHTGFGSEEDSLASCLALRPKPPPKDIKKLMAGSGIALRFEASMDNYKPEDCTRKFVVCVYLSDDSVSIWESRRNNSGHDEGKFSERSRKRNEATGEWYKPQDFCVGATVILNSVPFKILRADEYTLKFMEEFKAAFPVADMDTIASKLTPIQPELAPTGAIKADAFIALCKKYEIALTEHEVITVLRNCGEPGTSSILIPKLIEALVNLGKPKY